MPKLVVRLADTDEIFAELDRRDDASLYDEWLRRTPDGWSNGTVYVRVERSLKED